MPPKIDLGKAPDGILELDNKDILEEFIFALEAAGASEDTVRAYRSAIKDFLEFLGEKPLRNVSLRDIILWRNHRLKNGFSKAKTRDKKKWQTTLHYYSMFLNRFFNWLGLNIRIPRIRKPPRKIHVLNDDEIRKLLKSIRDPLDKLILFILLDTGLRSKELLGIRVSDIDFENRTITVTSTKYDKERKVLVTSRTIELIRSWIELKNLGKEDRLIPLTYSGLYKRIKRLGKRAGIPVWKIRPHILRHTFATQALKKGLSLPYLQRLLGHSDIKTTQVYLHVTVDDIRSEYDKVMEVNTYRCPNCGREIPADARFCPYCGYVLVKEKNSSSIST
ncbi:site-specific tyrosine recombinase/integron integrase [Staphylothermus hellenicus]|uniref:Tyrosine recombinase XerA n=1 Tax=Staphylothermus hellenicus (strain DSM 12710 / JCM 10830 / BK20S6-10-b1 / P8) TaxID=591019 RepID=D7D9F6_STAHD|nr:site-specific tyrosine recombinase/integron integrase [Staphylothermus hellenicus]ADI32402.1 integrase family protein [Staphylothermus hellenicus DSM 12710]